MAKNIYYKYNPVTDSFERYYPSLKTRLVSLCKLLGLSLAIGLTLFFIIFFCLDSPTEANLRQENAELRANFNILDRRLNTALKVMEDIQKRDDNFYRVIMQLDPVSRDSRIAGLDNEQRYRDLQKLSDAALLTRLSRDMDLLERQLYAQSISFDQLRKSAAEQKNKFMHIPATLPVAPEKLAISAGYGMRRNPISNDTRFHSGMDIAATVGTPVYATADGRVEVAERKGAYGNCVDIAHGYNYLTRYACLSDILVKNGQNVKRGDLIGRVGSSGKSTAPHLHYEVRFKGEAQNPVNYYFMDLTPAKFAEMMQAADNAADVLD